MEALDQELENPIRAEIFSIERLEKYALYLATELQTSKRNLVSRPLLPRMRENGAKLLLAYQVLAQAIHDKETISPGAEWLVDNFHIVEDQLREIRHDLPIQFYRELPKLAVGDLAGYPRIYALALALVAHSDSRIDIETIRRFIIAFQTVAPLSIGELWAFAITLRLVLVENLSRFSNRILRDREKREMANRLADQLMEASSNKETFGELTRQIPGICRHSVETEYAFIAQLAKRLRDQDPEQWPAIEALEKHLETEKTSTEQAVHIDHQIQASNQVSIANIITSMRLLSSIDWQDFFESISLVDRVLERDPDGSYINMDFVTRDRYRHVIEKVAKKTNQSELKIAEAIVTLAQHSKDIEPNNRRRAHVGFYLIANGIEAVEAMYARKLKPIYTHSYWFYFGLLGFFTILLLAVPLSYAFQNGSSNYVLSAIAFFSLIPISELSINFTNFLVTNWVPPWRLPKMDLSDGIPPTGRTMVVVPCLLASLKTIQDLLEKLEIHYLGNIDIELYFALLTDYTDADKAFALEDEGLLKAAVEGIKKLNQKYSSKETIRSNSNIFFILNRKRLWNSGERKWMGWERKRGKLQEFNRLLRGAQDTSFDTTKLPTDFLQTIRFVITLDADSQMPRDTARKLIGTILHPLNQARFDPKLGRVSEGYGILQPRISISLESSSRSRFSKIFSGYVGIDPYTTAVSDVYQDLFHEGSFTGKGLYDVDAFEAALKNQVPENTILSHDLFEGLFARTALVSDVELFDDYPKTYHSFFTRQHRWIRGDWQIAWWLLPFVPRAKRQWVRNSLPFLSRWKIGDNLRRSLVAPFTLLWFLLASVSDENQRWFWMASGFFIIVFPNLIYLMSGVLNSVRDKNKTPVVFKFADLKLNLMQSLLSFVFLAHQAFISTDAISRFLYRALISKTKRLEWATAAQVEASLVKKSQSFWQTLWPVEIVLLVAAALMFVLQPRSLLVIGGFFVIWAGYPLAARYLGQGLNREIEPLTEEGRLMLRQIGRRTWNFFDTFVGERDNWLPPDNVQEDPKQAIAHRTSPTNIGIYILSVVAARDMGYLSHSKVFKILRSTLTTMLSLEMYEGHYLNWYNTEDKLALQPKYISTVDSGNLAGYILAVKQACLETRNATVINKSWVNGLLDTLAILGDQIENNQLLSFLAPELFDIKETLKRAQLDRFSQCWTWTGAVSLSLDTLRYIFLAKNISDARTCDTIFWIDSCRAQVEMIRADLQRFVPWLNLESKPEEFIKRLDKNMSFNALLKAYDDACGSLEKSKTNNIDFLTVLNLARKNILLFLEETSSIAVEFNTIFEKMNFSFLMDESRGVFTIGFNLSDRRYDNAVYDLLASESRLASFVAIAKGDVSQKHWFRLGRQLVPTLGGRALISWTASMFEYLMPTLVLKTYENTLLYETLHSVVHKQISYGNENHVAWGISESGYNARDLQLNYQYGPFGVPGLGLKRGLSNDLVVSPYSTLLAAMIRPMDAVENIKKLIHKKMLSRNGFYEAIDYTAERLPEKQSFAIVKSCMAHHQGMSLVAIDNVVNDNVMQNRFHNEPIVRATQLLLQERIPRNVLPVLPKSAEVEMETESHVAENSFVRQYSDPNISTPRVQLLSNGNYTVMISTAGSGYSRCGDRAVTRWVEDGTRDHWGNFIFVRDIADDHVWSTTYQPQTNVIPDYYAVTFGEARIEFRRRDGDISSYTEILVAPEDNVEIRHLSLTNHGSKSKIIEVTSYLEPVLALPANDLDHPAFSKLFIQTEFFSSRNALLAHRRKRSVNEKEFWGLHAIVSDSTFVSGVEYETDRARFIGRGRTLLNPKVFENYEILSNSIGSTLDPIFSLRARLEIPAGMTVRVAFTTGMAFSKEEALALSDRYHDINSFDRECKIAWTKSQVDLRHLNIDADSAYLFQRLAERILYSDPTVRPSTHQIAANASMQQNLWPYGISGDLPIVVVSVTDVKDIAMIRKLLRCHEYLRFKGLVYDFIILNEHGPTYFQGLQEELQNQIRSAGAFSLLNKQGGIFILRSDITPKEHRAHIQAVSRVSLVADRPLKDQIDKKSGDQKYPYPLPNWFKKTDYPRRELMVPKLEFFNEYGGFSETRREYTIVLNENKWTPAPWLNVIGNTCDFGFQISESGSSFTWSINSQGNRLTPWSNDPVCDPSGEILYLRDESSGEVWNPTPLPIREKSNYIITHGQGYSSFVHISRDIESTLTCFVPKDETVKISILKLKNLSSKKRTVSLTSYTEWVLGSQRQKTAPNLICDIDADSGAIFARNPFDNEFSSRVAFSDICESNKSFTCSRKEFLGRNGNYSTPSALKRRGLSRKKGTGHDPCAVLQTTFEIEPAGEITTLVLLGQCENADKARDLVMSYRRKSRAQEAFAEVTQYWHSLTNTIQVTTPEPAFDILMNSWLFYQNLSCRFWSRTAFYQSGGAFGFRDQLQDCMALVYSAPEMARSHILRASARQFKEGDVQHWWHPPTGRGVRTRMTDDLLWLPYVVSFYVRVTGDTSLLAQKTSFIEAPLLNPEQEDSYTTPTISHVEVSVFEHCIRAIDRSLALGRNGLPLIGTGDWNDGMNRVGVHGSGESIWLGWFLYKVVVDFLPYCSALAKEKIDLYETHLSSLKTAIEANGWDGEWYRRAYFDDGLAIGSKDSEDCKIDSIAQSWSVLSGVGDPNRAALAMKKVDEFLVRSDSQIILLLSPPFDKGKADPGYIKGYVPGVRENGGQYTHAAIWAIMAFAELGEGDKAMSLLNMINPVKHANDKIKSDKYKIEPYVLAGDVYQGNSIEGRGGWSWYTGSASWYYRAGLESILGFQRRGNKLSFKPCIPKSWKSFEIIYTYGTTKYKIKIENPYGLDSQSAVIFLDGVLTPTGEIDLQNTGENHSIEVQWHSLNTLETALGTDKPLF